MPAVISRFTTPLKSLRPGGLLIIKAFRPEQLRYRELNRATGGPQLKARLFSEAMLRDDFADAAVLELDSVDADMGSEGTHSGLTAVVRSVFQRAAPADAAMGNSSSR